MDNTQIKKMLDILFPELEIIIDEIECLPRQQLNENNEWVPDTPAYFVTVKISEYPSPLPNISEQMSLYTGFEFNFMRR
jgi:hypothetical protein